VSSNVLSISLFFNSSTKNTAKANLNIIKRYEFKVIAGQPLISGIVCRVKTILFQYLE
jgi:hypothetical protein